MTDQLLDMDDAESMATIEDYTPSYILAIIQSSVVFFWVWLFEWNYANFDESWTSEIP